jgi:glyoxylase-like metal-dependent hydrolase (beta-lactamase superfamily II)
MAVTDMMIGDVQVTRVEEMVGPFVAPSDWFIDFDEAELQRHLHWLAPRYYDLSSKRMISSIHSWVLRTPRRVILIDTCTGNHKSRPGWDAFNMLNTPYLEHLRAAGLAPEEVDVVLCTHLHVDHVGWNTRLADGRWVPTFPNAKYLMSRADHDFFSVEARDPATPDLVRNTYNDSVLPVVEAKLAVMVEGVEELEDGLRLAPAPGHTPGQVRLDLDSGGRRAMFCGDVLHHPLQVPLWRWRTRVCTDPDLARATRHDVLAHCAEHDTMLLPAHFPDPHGAYISAKGDEFEISFERMRQ